MEKVTPGRAAARPARIPIRKVPTRALKWYVSFSPTNIPTSRWSEIGNPQAEVLGPENAAARLDAVYASACFVTGSTVASTGTHGCARCRSEERRVGKE